MKTTLVMIPCSDLGDELRQEQFSELSEYYNIVHYPASGDNILAFHGCDMEVLSELLENDDLTIMNFRGWMELAFKKIFESDNFSFFDD